MVNPRQSGRRVRRSPLEWLQKTDVEDVVKASPLRKRAVMAAFKVSNAAVASAV
jgi:hypothetical protein